MQDITTFKDIWPIIEPIIKPMYIDGIKEILIPIGILILYFTIKIIFRKK